MNKKVSVIVLIIVIVVGGIFSAKSLSSHGVAEEQDGFVSIDATDFYKQTKSDTRAWEVVEDENGKYIEILPDTRITHDDDIIPYDLEDPMKENVNFSDVAGAMAVAHFKVKINNPGRYYVWVCTYSTGTEDNGVHVGIDGTWPESGRRMQWCPGKNMWTWTSRQRTSEVHCGVSRQIYLDIEEPGIHDLQFSMREDGFNMKQIILTKTYDIRGKVEDNVSYDEVGLLLPQIWSTEVEGDYSKCYYEENRKVYAVNTLEQPVDKWSAAKRLFDLEDGVYDINFTSLLETDGESSYRVLVNGELAMGFQNPRILNTETVDYTPYIMSAVGVNIKKGNEITVLFKPHSNGLVPENDAFAFARARWAGVEFVPSVQK